MSIRLPCNLAGRYEKENTTTTPKKLDAIYVRKLDVKIERLNRKKLMTNMFLEEGDAFIDAV